VRAEYPYIDEDYKNYLLEHYEETYYPEKIVNAGKAAYVERNCEMINSSSVCVVYYDESYTPKRKNSKIVVEKNVYEIVFTKTAGPQMMVYTKEGKNEEE